MALLVNEIRCHCHCAVYTSMKNGGRMKYEFLLPAAWRPPFTQLPPGPALLKEVLLS